MDEPLLSPARSSWRDGVHAKAFIIAVIFALFVDYASLTAVIPLVPNFFADLGIPSSASTALFASKSIIQILFNPFAGKIADSGSAIPLLVLSIIFMILPTLLFAYGMDPSTFRPGAEPLEKWTTFGILLAARSLQGFASSGILTGGMTQIAAMYADEERGAAMGNAMSGIALGVLTGAPLGGLIGSAAGRASPFLGLACLLVVPVLILVFAVEQGRWPQPAEDGPGSRRSSSSTKASVYKDKHVIWLAVCIAISNMSIALIEPIIPLYLRQEFNYGESTAGLIYGCQALGYLITTPIAGIVSDKVTKSSLMIAGQVLVACGIFLMMINDSSTGLVCLCLSVTGIGIGLVDTPSMALLTILAEATGDPGSAVAIQDIAVNVGFAAGPLLAGLIFGLDSTASSQHQDFWHATMPMSVVCLFLVPSLFYVRKRERNSDQRALARIDEEYIFDDKSFRSSQVSTGNSSLGERSFSLNAS